MQGTTVTISCMPDPYCVNDGGFTDLYFTTYVITPSNPQVRLYRGSCVAWSQRTLHITA